MAKKALLLSDIHQKISFLKDFDLFLSRNKFDFLIFAGDLTNRNEDALSYAKDFFKIAEKRFKDIYMIHGNNEPQEVINLYKKKGYLIHLNPKKIGKRHIVGIGGWGEGDFRKIDKYLGGSILVTHLPPKIAETSFKNQPQIHISGHLHFSESCFEKNGVLYVCLKSASRFLRAGVLDLDKDKVKFISLA